jgi:hypothetical protein
LPATWAWQYGQRQSTPRCTDGVAETLGRRLAMAKKKDKKKDKKDKKGKKSKKK